MTSFTSPKYLLSVLDSGITVALTAPFVRDSEVLVGYALSPDEGHCAVVPVKEFVALCPVSTM